MIAHVSADCPGYWSRYRRGTVFGIALVDQVECTDCAATYAYTPAIWQDALREIAVGRALHRLADEGAAVMDRDREVGR
jgi:hypothetical protein